MIPEDKQYFDRKLNGIFWLLVIIDAAVFAILFLK